MKSDEFLAGLGACREALGWAGGREAVAGWAACERGDWLLWLLGEMTGQPGWPTADVVGQLMRRCMRRYLVCRPARRRVALEGLRARIAAAPHGRDVAGNVASSAAILAALAESDDPGVQLGVYREIAAWVHQVVPTAPAPLEGMV